MKLENLHLAHTGLTEAMARSFCEASAVCLDRFHAPPLTVSVEHRGSTATLLLEWEPADASTRNAYAELYDSTRDGAYAVSFVAVEAHVGLVVIGRAEHGSGSDWYVAPAGKGIDEMGLPDLDDPEVCRLEVSGTLSGDLRRRLREKLDQLRHGLSSLPGLAAAVGFEHGRVLIEKI